MVWQGLFSVNKSAMVAANGLRAGDRSPVLRLRQGYGACALLAEVYLAHNIGQPKSDFNLFSKIVLSKLESSPFFNLEISK